MSALFRIPEEMFEPSRDERLRGRLRAEVESRVGLDPKPFTSEGLMEREPPLWYMERILPEDGMALLFGPPKTGKTFLAMEWAYLLATGQGWHEYRVERPVRVLYLAAEGLGSLGERLKALQEARGFSGFPVNLQWMVGARHLFHEGETVTDWLAELYAVMEDFLPHVVFVDTLARHTPGGNVSDNLDMGLVVGELDKMRQAFGSTFVIVHHTKKDGSDFLGATALYGATDSMIELRPTGVSGAFQVRVETRDWDDHTVPFPLQIRAVREKAGWAVVGALVGQDPQARDVGLGSKQLELVELVSKQPGLKTAEIGAVVWPKLPASNDRPRQSLKSLEEKGLIRAEGSPTRWYATDTTEEKF